MLFSPLRKSKQHLRTNLPPPLHFTSSALINRGGPVIKTPLQPFNSPAQNESYRASHKSRHHLFLSNPRRGGGGNLYVPGEKFPI